MDQSRQLVFNPNPDLYEYSVVDVGDHVGRCVADHVRLADVIGELQTFSHVLVGIGNDQVVKWKVGPGQLISRLHGGVDGGRRIGNRNQVLCRGVGRHALAVVVELGGRTIPQRDNPQLIG